MLSFDDAINILNNLPQELVSVAFNYMNGIDMVNFINNDNICIQIKSLNVTNDELNVWNLMKNSDNKLFEWCKILYYANIYNFYYKNKYEHTEIGYKPIFSLPSNKEYRYIQKLYIGLFLNAGEELHKAYYYSNYNTNKINFMFNTMNTYPNQFNFNILSSALNIYKYDTNESYLKYAIKIKEIYNSTQSYINSLYLSKIIQHFSDEKSQLLISLLLSNISFETAYHLANPTRKFTDVLINKFKELKQELNIKDELLLSHIRNNKAINQIRLFKSKNISSNGIENLLNLNKDLLDYIIKNNIIYDFDYDTWSKLNFMFYNINDVFQEIFTKFTIKQQNNIRMKELMEHSTKELLDAYIKENVNKILDYYNKRIHANNHRLITTEQYFKVYIELTDFQMNTFNRFINLNFNFEQALLNTYQVVEY